MLLIKGNHYLLQRLFNVSLVKLVNFISKNNLLFFSLPRMNQMCHSIIRFLTKLIICSVLIQSGKYVVLSEKHFFCIVKLCHLSIISGRIWSERILHGSRQSVHTQEQRTNGRLPRPPFGNYFPSFSNSFYKYS